MANPGKGTLDEDRLKGLGINLGMDSNQSTFIQFCEDRGETREEAEQIMDSNTSEGKTDFKKCYNDVLMKWNKRTRGAYEELDAVLAGAELAEGPGPEDDLPCPYDIGSVDSRTTGSTGLLGDARRRTVESAQRSVDPPHPSSNSSANASLHGWQAFYDIYLVYSENTEHVRNVKAIIHRNGWKMTTPYDSRLGVPKMDSIEEALKTCSHLILVITEEDCRKNDSERTMTIEMAFQSSSEKGMAGRVIPIRCCDEMHLPNKLKSLTNACVIDANLEDRLKKSINVSIRKKREEGTSGGSDDSSQPSASSN